MTKDNLAQQMDNVLVVVKEKPEANLPVRTNNWMGIQGGGDWEGLAEEQIHPRQLTFNVLAEDNTYVESDQCDLVIFGRGSGVLDSPTTEVPTPAYDGS